MSILSFPNRGPWGSSSWRGNCSGYIYKELFEMLKPNSFCDPMQGSGTSIEVAKEMGIEAYGFDLHSGFNALKDSLLEKIGKPVDLVISHPPYAGMILYSGKGGMWGDQPHKDDLSHCIDDEDFNEKLFRVMLNQREATVRNGFYGTLIGDWRHDGVYSSYQAELISRLPPKEIAGVIIKAQHNVQSNSKSYGRMKLPFIQHEYLVICQRKAGVIVDVLFDLHTKNRQRARSTWKAIVSIAMTQLGGHATLTKLYEKIAEGANDERASNPSWQAKVRQTLQLHPDHFTSSNRGQWQLVA